MIIRRVALRNYRRFAEVELECPENIIGIIGRNGAGKTTLVEAIGWALYGNVITRTGKGDIRSQFAGESETCSVELEFEYGGEEYRILRQLRGKNAVAEAAIYRAGEAAPDAVQERGVNEYVEQLLRLDYRSFYASVFARQRELAALSAMPPEERRKSIARLINIDRIDKARERVLADRNGKNRYIEGMRSALIDPDLLEQRIAAATAESLRLGEAMAREAEAVTRHELGLGEARAVMERLAGLRSAWQEHQNRILGWQASRKEQLAALQRSREELKLIAAAEEELETMSGTLQGLTAARSEKERLDGEELRQVQRAGLLEQISQNGEIVSAGRGRIGAARNRRAGLQALAEERAALLRREEELEKSLSEARELQQHWKSEGAAAGKAGTETRTRKEQIEKLGPDGECPTCTQKLSGHYPLVLVELEEKLAALRLAWQTAVKNLETAEKSVAEQELALRTLRREKESLLRRITADTEAAADLERMEEELAAAEKRLAELEQTLAGLGEVIYDRETHLQARARLAELEAMQRRADQLTERASRRGQVAAEIGRTERMTGELTRMEEQELALQAVLGYEESAFQAADAAVKAAMSTMIEAQKSHASAREAAARSRAVEENLQAQKEEQEKKRQEIAKTADEIRYLDALDLYLKKFRVDLVGRIRPLLARRASELLGLTTRGRYTRLELDEEYQISLYDGPRSFPLGRFSGGEQDLANLCLRVAISQILAERSGGAPINFIVLDEIFGSQDEERKSLILDALAQLSSQFRQIFMITHVESIRDNMQVIVEVGLVDEQRSEVRML